MCALVTGVQTCALPIVHMRHISQIRNNNKPIMQRRPSTRPRGATLPPMTPNQSPYKSKGGLGRLINALRYSAQGLGAAFRHEAAFRQELLLVAVLAPIAIWLGRSLGEILLLLGTLFFVLIIELLNSEIGRASCRERVCQYV